MPKLKTIIKQIKEMEKFDVVFLTKGGAKVRIDKEGFHPYKGSGSAKDHYTVTQWKRKRFNAQYGGYECDVLKGDKSIAPGQTTLKKLRSTY